MAKISDIDIPSLLFQEGAAPSTPAATKWRVYAKTDGLYYIDDAGVETGPLAASGAAATMVGAKAIRSSSGQAISNATETTATYQTEDFDDDTMIDLGTSTSRVTCKTAGRFLIGAGGVWASDADGYRQLRLIKNGTDELGRKRITAGSAIPIGQQIWAIVPLAVNDYVELFVLHTAGANLDWSYGTGGVENFITAQQVA